MIPLAGTAPTALAPLSAALRVAHSPNSGSSSSIELSKLRKAAGEFESILLESLWKSMKETFSDSGDPNSDPTLKSFDDWGIQVMASAVGNSGGLGIKNMILKYLEPTLPVGDPGTAPIK